MEVRILHQVCQDMLLSSFVLAMTFEVIATDVCLLFPPLLQYPVNADLAIKDFSKAIRLDPQCAVGWERRAEVS